MEQSIYEIEFYREGVRIGHPEPFTGYRLNAEYHAARKGRRNNADFVRVLDEGVEVFSRRFDA
jgi:hypothetical protein